MSAFRSILLCFTVLLFVNCSNDDSQDTSAQDNLPLPYKEMLNVSYGNDSEQVYDIYLPENRTLETKTIILVHGGGWDSGDKDDMNVFKSILLRDLPGYAVVNVNYRLASETVEPHPMQVNDIDAVINHLKTNDESYTISKDYGFIGVSAGAHLSLLWSYAFDNENSAKMVASIVGPTNFNDPAYLNSTDPNILAFINLFKLDSNPGILEDASPFHKITASAPPTILFYGGKDPLVPLSQGEALKGKLAALNIVHECTIYPEEGHGWVGESLFDTWIKLKAFTLEHL